MTLLAAATSELFKTEVQSYSPLLAAQQPAARLIAARTLHEVYGARMLPWLIGGGQLPRSCRLCLPGRAPCASAAQGVLAPASCMHSAAVHWPPNPVHDCQLGRGAPRGISS